ncbi:hypothetical protein AGROH133_14690 (plasmid) [Agrobacterium tumefaciens]|nr:hypothetical protein AGROH133_14690 [Agrobacterium tumefaciens]
MASDQVASQLSRKDKRVKGIADKFVKLAIPAFRQIAATDTPSSPCLKMNDFWASENFDAFMLPLLVPTGKLSRKTPVMNWSSFQGSE